MKNQMGWAKCNCKCQKAVGGRREGGCKTWEEIWESEKKMKKTKLQCKHTQMPMRDRCLENANTHTYTLATFLQSPRIMQNSPSVCPARRVAVQTSKLPKINAYMVNLVLRPPRFFLALSASTLPLPLPVRTLLGVL